MTSNNFARKMKSLVAVTSCSSMILSGLLYYQNDEKYFDNILMPLTRLLLSPEKAYELTMFACKWNLIPRNKNIDPPNLVNLTQKNIYKSSKNTLNSQHHFVEFPSKIPSALLVLTEMPKASNRFINWVSVSLKLVHSCQRSRKL